MPGARFAMFAKDPGAGTLRARESRMPCSLGRGVKPGAIPLTASAFCPASCASNQLVMFCGKVPVCTPDCTPAVVSMAAPPEVAETRNESTVSPVATRKYDVLGAIFVGNAPVVVNLIVAFATPPCAVHLAGSIVPDLDRPVCTANCEDLTVARKRDLVKRIAMPDLRNEF